MAVFRVLDDHVLSESEYRSRQQALTQFLSIRAAGQALESFTLSEGRTLTAVAPAPPAAAAWTPIGRGKPLTIMIRHVYTGRHPDNSFLFGDGSDIAIVSGVKNYDVFDATTRALNFLVQHQAPHAHIRRPSPFADGTSLVAYSPAIMTDSMTISFELAVASFPQELVNGISGAFNTLAGIPLLLPYAGYLLGAGQLFKLAGNAGHALFDGIKFSVTDSIDFDVPGAEPAVADFRVLTDNSLDASQFRYREPDGLIDANGNLYAGDTPYIVVSLDGAPHDELKKFAPTVASAAVLQRFFQVQSGAQVAIDTVVQGLELASDLKYREMALNLQAKIGQTTDPAEKAKLQADMQAALKNISQAALKPPTG